MLKRQLELESPTPIEIDALSFRNLLREAAEKGIIDNIEKWFVYREQRNITSQTYDFFDDATKLLQELQKH